MLRFAPDRGIIARATKTNVLPKVALDMKLLKLPSIFRSKQGAPPAAPQWSQRIEDRPWFDQADALDVLEKRRVERSLSDFQFECLRLWIEEGYFILPGAIAHETIDGMLGDLEALWSAEQPIDGLMVQDMVGEAGQTGPMAHADLLALDSTERDRLKATRPWRVLGFHEHSDFVRSVFENKVLAAWASLVLDRPTLGHYTINFTYGSRQHLHQDTAVFQIHPMNNLVSSWLACEDVTPDCGPLIYYPGSHREPMFDAFDNYPQTSLKTCERAETERYEEHLDRLAEEYERHEFLAKKGDMLFWHPMLLHGGSEIKNPAATRKSYVCHYIPPGVNKEAEIVGPQNW